MHRGVKAQESPAVFTVGDLDKVRLVGFDLECTSIQLELSFLPPHQANEGDAKIYSPENKPPGSTLLL